MADEVYDLPQVIALALQTQRGELLKALGPQHAKELVAAMTEERIIHILNLIADLIDDRYKLKCAQHEDATRLQQIGERIDDIQRDVANLRHALKGGE